ncbi:MAG: PIN domain-containing protein [Acidobacteriota bacterium]
MIVDTNAPSAFVDGSPLAIAVLETANEIAVPVIALGEFRYGIAHSKRRREYEAWLTIETAVEYSLLRSELRPLAKPIPANDVWIAALCRQHQLPVLSRDKHFDAVKGLRRQAW